MKAHPLKVGDRVNEWGRGPGVLLEIYEMTDGKRNHTPIGRKSALVHFDGDKIPTAGVWLDNLHPEIAGLRSTSAKPKDE